MSEELNLKTVYIPNPCPVKWEEMSGDERVRLCSQCNKHVYDLSAMTAGEAVRLLRQGKSNLCLQYYQRPDGTILTERCPRALRMLRDCLRLVAGFLAALFSLGTPSAWAGDTKAETSSCDSKQTSAPGSAGNLSPQLTGPPARLGGLLVPMPASMKELRDQEKLKQISDAWNPEPYSMGTIEIVVDPYGKVIQSTLTARSGDASADAKALAAARKSVFLGRGAKTTYTIHPAQPK